VKEKQISEIHPTTRARDKAVKTPHTGFVPCLFTIQINPRHSDDTRDV